MKGSVCSCALLYNIWADRTYIYNWWSRSVQFIIGSFFSRNTLDFINYYDTSRFVGVVRYPVYTQLANDIFHRM